MESISIKIDLSVHTHDAVKEHPYVVVSLNGYPQFGDFCKENTSIEFDVELADDTDNCLRIEYNNKDAKNDVVLGDDKMPIKDKSIEIDSISFDDIELNFFELKDEEVIKYECLEQEGNNAKGFNATKLPWNGHTSIYFRTPIYLWLLENL